MTTNTDRTSADVASSTANKEENKYLIFHPNGWLGLIVDYSVISLITFITLIVATVISSNHGKHLVFKIYQSFCFNLKSL